MADNTLILAPKYDACTLMVFFADPKNSTTLRSLYYSPVNRDHVKENQIRCGEHSDYGSITLLFQSSEGLQVK